MRVQVRRAAEQRQLRQVGLPVPAVRRRVDQPGPPVGRPQHVARPQVAVECGRAARSPAYRSIGVDDLLDGRDVGRRRARRGRPTSAGTAAAGGRRTTSPTARRPGVLSRGSGPMKPGHGAPNASAPARCSAGQRPGRTRSAAGAATARRARSTPARAGPAGRRAPPVPAPPPASRSQRSPAASASKKPVRRRPGRPGLGEDRRAVVEGQPGCGAQIDRPAPGSPGCAGG